MLIDCDTCAVRGPACGDCVVTVLLGAPPTVTGDGHELDGAEQAAIAVLAGSGLVPPLRLLPVGRADSRPDSRPGSPAESPARETKRAAG
jgi:hypothetical protein